MQHFIQQLDPSDYIQILSTFLGAFFAFVFFIILDCLNNSINKRREIILYLEHLKKYVVSQIYFFETNLIQLDRIKKIKPISISLFNMRMFPIEDYVDSKLYKYKVSESIIRFIISLEVSNDNISLINNYMMELSNLSRKIIFEGKESQLKDTMGENMNDLECKAKEIKDFLDQNKKKIGPLIDEINFTLWYEKAYFWSRLLFIIKKKINKNYREKKIIELSNK